MSLGERLRDARKAVGLTQKALADKLGVKHNAVSNWENGRNSPDPDMIERVCIELAVSPNHLLMGGSAGSAQYLHSARETGLLEKYRRLDEAAKNAVDALVEHYCRIAARPVEAARPALELICGRISSQSVAAGRGTYLDEDSFEQIFVASNEKTRRAAFYVPVSGDSMEPRYRDGDILIIEKAPVRPGEIGVFTLGGSGYVKVCGRGELISLNPAYDPIPYDDGIICNGKVIGVLDSEWIAHE